MNVAHSAARAERRRGKIEDVVGSAVFGAAFADAVARSASPGLASTTMRTGPETDDSSLSFISSDGGPKRAPEWRVVLENGHAFSQSGA